MTWTLRPAAAADAATLSELAERTFRETFSASTTAENMDLHCASAFSPAVQAAEIANADIRTVVAESAGRLVAFAQVHVRSEPPGCVSASPSVELRRIYAERSVHGSGVAGDLMDHVLETAGQHDAAVVWLGVWEHNARAIRFYQKRGFAEVGDHVFDVGTDRQRDLVMVRPLTARTAEREHMTREFNALALHAAMDAERVARGLSWRQVAAELWDQSNVLNDQRRDHPISVTTLTGIAKRGDCTCQHALFILRWLDRTPESFLVPPQTAEDDTRLPVVGGDRRLRWDLGVLAEALDGRRRERRMTWKALAAELGCTEHQVQGLRAVRYAIGMRLAMRMVQSLERPAAAFIYAATW